MRIFVLLVLAVLAACSSGCTVIGLGIGSAVPRYEPQTGYPDFGVRVKLANEQGSELASGTLTAREHGNIIVTDAAGAEKKVRDADVARIETHSGTYWKTGLIAGIVLDCIAVTGAVIGAVAASMAMHNFQAGFGWR